MLVVFLGGCLGGLARYLAVRQWPAAGDRFPWAVWSVNMVGAFILTVTIVIAAELAPSRYLRPLVGTGFCGALTTFSSVVVTVDQLWGRHRAAVAVGYLFATAAGALLASWAGLVTGRWAAARPIAYRRRPG